MHYRPTKDGGGVWGVVGWVLEGEEDSGQSPHSPRSREAELINGPRLRKDGSSERSQRLGGN